MYRDAHLSGLNSFDIHSPDKEEVSEYPGGQDQMVFVERQGTVLSTIAA